MKLKIIAILLLSFMIARADENVSSYPLFQYDIVAHAAKEDLSRGRIEIFIEVLYDDLLFLKTTESYDAEYEISVIILEGNEQVDGDLWKESVSVETFDQTNSRRDIDLTHKTFELEPGKYTVKLRLEDVESRKSYAFEEKIKVDDYSEPPVSGSEITFVRQIEMDGDRIKTIFPEVTTSYKGLGHPAFAYFEIYNPQMADSARISYQILGEKSKFTYRRTASIALSGERSAYSIPLPTDSLSHDRYNLIVEIVANEKMARLEKTFYIRWGGLPRSAEDLDMAIKQLQYIANSKEWKKLKKASDDKKLQAFIEFWKTRDPSPGTEQNEAMESYYAKIDAANQAFTVMGREGWQTDRGIVFVVLGPPDEVIRNDYPSGSRPYQIWQYYSINRQFEFFDRHGFGDYEFVYPVSIAELQRFIGRQ
ncbi:GWxTD domain-containing protein [candidate division KSB1 bacterium]|nr:GWxTD domain-containing protein [candidate division KSB1 bacterium]